MKILQSRTFERKVRQLKKQEKKALDQQILKIVNDPKPGHEKRGELRGVFVHKFKIHATQHLLACRFKNRDVLEIIMIGPHENYYRDPTNYLKARR